MCGVILRGEHSEQLKQHIALRTLGQQHKKVMKVHWDNQKKTDGMQNNTRAWRSRELSQVIDGANDL